MKTKLKNKVVYIPDEKTLEEMRILIEKAGLQIDPDYKRLLRPTWKKCVERIGIAVILILSAIILFSCGNTKNKKSDYVRLKDRPTYATEVKDTFVDSKGKVWLNSRYVCPPCDCDKGIIQIIAENRTERIKERQDGRNYRSDNRNDRKENKDNKKAETKINNSDNKADTKQTKSNNKVDKAKVKQDGKTDRKWIGWLNGLMLGLGLGIILTIFVSWWIGAYRRKEKKVDDDMG